MAKIGIQLIVFNNRERKDLDGVLRDCKEAELTFCYHNHSFEFEKFNGTKGIYLLGKEADPELVKFNINVGWVHIRGGKPYEFIKRYKDRIL